MESAKSQDTKDVFSKEETLASVDGDRELLQEVVGMFIQEYPSSVAAIRKAIDEQNAHSLDRAAHTLKGMAGNFGAHIVVEAALKLEMMGKSGQFAGAGETFALLQKELEQVRVALEQFAGET